MNQLKALLARAFERKAEILRRREKTAQKSFWKMAESRRVECRIISDDDLCKSAVYDFKPPTEELSMARCQIIAPEIDLDPETRPPTFSSRVVKLVRERFDNDAPTVYRAAGVSRQVYSKIISNTNYPVSRHTAIQLAFGLKLPPKEAGSLLHAAGFHFSPCRDEDIIFTTCLEAGIYDLTEVNQVLQEHNITPLNLQH